MAILAAILAMLEDRGERIPRALHRAILRLLCPAESAVRRLIVIAARGLVAKLPATRPLPAGLAIPRKPGGRAAFRLFDRRKALALQRRSRGPRSIPRIHVFMPDAPLAHLWAKAKPAAPPPADDTVAAQRLRQRLQALSAALDDLPRQARRLVRWRARRQQAAVQTFTSPLRPGPPPGHRRVAVYDVDHVLRECHGLAFDALRPDTS
jgi:hypothetical protein